VFGARFEFIASLKQSGDVMQRREFLSLGGEALILMPAGLFLVRYGGASGSDQTGSGLTNQPQVNGTKIIYMSSTVGDHSHTFGIEMSAIDMPPAAGVSGRSSAVGNHSHSVAVSAAQLSKMSAGQKVEVTSGTSAGHAHLFTFLKLA
jgi:hypothetical protein